MEKKLIHKKRVVVAMSGGVDSSVTAALLKQEGYDVIGLFMKNWSQPLDKKGPCPWVEDQKDVRRVCARLEIPCYTINFEKEYGARVVEYFFREYRAGRTPNPDVLCNKEIKFDLFRKAAKKLGADYMATGHYARLEIGKDGKVHLLKGVDKNKDQSYFLWMLGQEELQDTLLPIGDYTKPEIREMAKKWRLPTADKKDSQGICFIGPIEVREFLQTRISPKVGPVVINGGQIIGEHEGVQYYTIGQRLGLSRINWPTQDIPTLYVKSKDLKTNTLVAGEEQELYAKGLICDNMNWVVESPKDGSWVEVSVRYRQAPVAAKLEKQTDGRWRIVFREPQRAITPGQSVVIYKDEELIGGGVIINSQ